jgi:hypothetical protein
MLESHDPLPTWLAVVFTCAAVSGSACGDFRECSAPATKLARLPERLSQTGLYEDIAQGTLAPGVRWFTPNFALWSDSAAKQRFIALPDDAGIDTRDPDDWQFPVGTKFWKQFTRDGVRVETRLEQKIGDSPADWALSAYLWEPDDSDALRLSEGQTNARGTPHDVPRAADCLGCHAGRKSTVLGFSAVQLAHDPPSGDEIDLTALIASERLSVPPRQLPRVPGSAVQIAGLGYLHANCGHCHNQTRPDSDGPRCYDPERSFDFVLRVNELARVSDTAAYRTGLGDELRRGDPSHSRAIQRMRVRNPDWPSMPPLGTEQVDAEGVASVSALIESL